MDTAKFKSMIEEDDGFFSDVQTSGSMSKSLRALNKYVKKNLLYEDVDYEEDKEDSAYFSKECSPNESISKSDIESVKSNDTHDSGEPNETFSYKNVIEQKISEEHTDDYKSMQIIDQPEYVYSDVPADLKYENNDNNVNDRNYKVIITKNYKSTEQPTSYNNYSVEGVYDQHNIDVENKCADIHDNLDKKFGLQQAYDHKKTKEQNDKIDYIIPDHDINIGIVPSDCKEPYNDKTHSNGIKQHPPYETNKKFENYNCRKSINNGYQLKTEDYQDKNTEVSGNRQTISDVNKRPSDSDLGKINVQSKISASLTNLSAHNIEGNSKSVEKTCREKSRDKVEENRHTMHDFSEWVNRATVYPDVYAPLPYKSPRRYVESDVNIHYRCPVRHDPLPLVPERELARQQAEHMKRLYREQKRNKYLQENDIDPQDIDAFDAYIKELQDMQNRRHQDNFLPNQKSIVPLNRYDEADKIVAKALYAFNGQTNRELSFRKGEIINVRKQIDANWYEGELHGRIGLFPYNYVEILKGDVTPSPKKTSVIEGRARAKFDFTAQTNLELPLKKGELVVLTRRIDNNWWEGRNGNRTGIFPDSYVTVLQEPSQNKPESEPILSSNNSNKPMASPAAHGLMNGTAKRSMGSHSYMPQPNSPALANAPPSTQPLPGYVAKPVQTTLTPSERGYGPPSAPGVDLNNREPLFVDTNAEAIPYRAMYKYRPQNPDELELNEGDTVYVLEQCDDGWYVGSSQRTGRFGTFPGNYVERI